MHRADHRGSPDADRVDRQLMPRRQQRGADENDLARQRDAQALDPDNRADHAVHRERGDRLQEGIHRHGLRMPDRSRDAAPTGDKLIRSVPYRRYLFCHAEKGAAGGWRVGHRFACAAVSDRVGRQGVETAAVAGGAARDPVDEATRYLGVASSTAHRLLAMLAYRGFVRQDPVSKAYLPGPALTGVAFAIFGRIDIAGTVTPVLRGLSERLRETVHVGMLDGAAVRFVAAVEGPTAVRVASRLGRTMPAHCTSTGKAMLAQLPHSGIASASAARRSLDAHHRPVDRQPRQAGSRAFPDT